MINKNVNTTKPKAKNNFLSSFKNLFLKNGRKGDIDSDDFTRPTNQEEENFASMPSTKIKARKNINIISKNPSANPSHKSGNGSDLSSSDFEMKQKRIPIIGKFPAKTQYQIALGVLSLSFLILITGYFIFTSTKNNLNKLTQLNTELFSDVQHIDILFNSASIGREDSFKELQEELKKTDAKIADAKNLINYLNYNEIPAFQKISSDVELKWKVISDKGEVILKSKDILAGSSSQVNDLTKRIANINNMIERMAIVGMQLGVSQTSMNNISFLRFTLQKISQNVTTILLSEIVPPETISELKKDREDFKQALIELYNGDEKRSIAPILNATLLLTYEKLGTEWVRFSDKVDNIYSKAQDIVKAKTITIEVSKINKIIIDDLGKMLDFYAENTPNIIRLANVLMLIAVGFILLSIFVLIYIYMYEKDNRSLVDKIENNRNQNAILRLLDEMTPLSEGDLTKMTTVSEDITGTIADAINLTILDLSRLVKKIKESASNMRAKTGEANVVSINMLESSEVQALKINKTGESVLEVADAINKISKKTAESAKFAANSVEVSTSGAKQVQDSVNAMDAIRGNINDTVRLMKKLDESSRQVSEIVDLLSDITEETTVLALNATVQAAKAGDAGKGFKIVADSVQELALKAADATRKVGALINTTQTDIQAVVEAVNKTTDEVDRGTELSQKAGTALDEITKVSNNLAESILFISDETKKNAQTATEISIKIKEILETTKEAKVSNQLTAKSIGDIAKLSDELDSSVSGFKVN